MEKDLPPKHSLTKETSKYRRQEVVENSLLKSV